MRLTGETWIEIGDDVFIGSDSWLQVLGTPDEVAIRIGNGTSIVGDCTLSAALSIRLGERVLFARNVYIADHMHRYDDVGAPFSIRASLASDRSRSETAPGSGRTSSSGPNVRVGRGSVIGANSVVLSDVPDFSVAVGAPASVVSSFAGGAA